MWHSSPIQLPYSSPEIEWLLANEYSGIFPEVAQNSIIVLYKPVQQGAVTGCVFLSIV